MRLCAELQSRLARPYFLPSPAAAIHFLTISLTCSRYLFIPSCLRFARSAHSHSILVSLFRSLDGIFTRYLSSLPCLLAGRGASTATSESRFYHRYLADSVSNRLV